jgi:hypothetical protein
VHGRFRRGRAGGFDDDFDIGICDHGHGVVGDAGGGDAVLGPTDRPAGGARSVGGEVGDGRDFEARGCGHLRQEHGAELAGADQSDPDRPAGSEALLQQGVEVHRLGPSVAGFDV